MSLSAPVAIVAVLALLLGAAAIAAGRERSAWALGRARRWLAPALVIVALVALLVERGDRAPDQPALAVVYLLAALLGGLALAHRLLPGLPPLLGLVAGALGGLLLAGWLTFALALALARLGLTSEPLLLAAMVTLWAAALVAWALPLPAGWWRVSRLEAAVSAGAVWFGWWLYSQVFDWDATLGRTVVTIGTWADTGVHIPLIRSFARGDNLPPQYPLFAGPPIQYHFGYDFLVGVLERLGLRLDLAFNLPAALCYGALLVLIFEAARRLAGGRTAAGLCALPLLPLNSSLSYLSYFKRWPHEPVAFVRAFWDEWERLHYGPYNEAIISSHFTFVPYVNQRQLTAGMALGLLAVVLLLRPLLDRRAITGREAATVGALLGLGFPVNGTVTLAVVAVVGALLLLFRRWRALALIAAVSAVVIVPVGLLVGGQGLIGWHLGYIVERRTPSGFIEYWWLNFGLLLPLALLAALAGGRTRALIFLACLTPFALGNVLKLGADVAGTNHKLFNFWSALMVVFAGVALGWLATWRPRRRRWRFAGLALALTLLPPLTLSGLIDTRLIHHEEETDWLGDGAAAVAWVEDNTRGDAVFLAAPYFYMPPSLAGRRVFLGWPPFVANLGYPTAERQELIERIYRAPFIAETCGLLRANGIDFVQLNEADVLPDSQLQAEPAVWLTQPPVFEEALASGWRRFYAVARMCG